jgi:hypothetical protein
LLWRCGYTVTERNAATAIGKVRRLALLPNGTPVIARQHFRGVIDGQDVNGQYIVLFDKPVEFKAVGMKIYRGTFPVADVKEVKP